MYCSDCGQEMPKGQPVCANCGAQSGPPSGLKRTGVIVSLSVVATAVVLAAIGVGLWLGLRGDGKTAGVAGPDISTTTTVATTVADGFASAGSGDDLAQDPGEGFSSGDDLQDYFDAINELVGEIEFYDFRMYELTEVINANVPDTPTSVHGELEAMADTITTILGDLDHLPIPPELETADYWVKMAAAHMLTRVQVTIDGIEAMWDTGSATSATSFFDKGQAELDAYLGAIEAFYGGPGGST